MGCSRSIQQMVQFALEKGLIRQPSFQSMLSRACLAYSLLSKSWHVMVDLRAGSDTFKKWFGYELGPETGPLYVPKGFAHGFQALQEELVLVCYHGERNPNSSFTLAYDDPELAIRWPLPPQVSQLDAPAETLAAMQERDLDIFRG
jgi:dTDP-4-dehydrorhamnose 3,5-epimerase-like enzyme